MSYNNLIPFQPLCSDLAQADENKIFLDMEVANVLTVVLRYFPTELDISKWDFIRIALSSWTLSVSKSFAHYHTHNVSAARVRRCHVSRIKYVFFICFFRFPSLLRHCLGCLTDWCSSSMQSGSAAPPNCSRT